MYVYSNILGVFLFDKNLKLIRKKTICFKSIILLQKGAWAPEEKSLLKTIKEKNIVFLGYKKNELPNISVSFDKEKIHKLLKFFKNKNNKKFFEINLELTKQNIKSALTKDLVIIQTIKNIEELNKTTNRLTKRLKECYLWCDPNFSEKNNKIFIKKILKRCRKRKNPMILDLANEINNIHFLTEKQKKYLKKKMKDFATNLTKITGPVIGAYLILLAGSLKKLAFLPSSTIQLLGAEKAFFKYLKKGTKLPKHGIIFKHSFVRKAKNKAKAARNMASNIALAARKDVFGK